MIFCTTFNQKFLPGAETLFHSIRLFYPKEKILAVYDKDVKSFEKLKKYNVKFVPLLDGHDSRKHGKAYSTYQAMYEDQIICHIDSDAFLLYNINDIINRISNMGMDSVLAFYDNHGKGVPDCKIWNETNPINPKNYILNAGIMFYNVGPVVTNLIQQFFHDCIFKQEIGNQGIIRALVAIYHQKKLISFELNQDARHYNPIWKQAEEMELKNGIWFNKKTGLIQHIYHATGGGDRKIGMNKPWDAPQIYKKSELEAYKWVLNQPLLK